MTRARLGVLGLGGLLGLLSGCESGTSSGRLPAKGVDTVQPAPAATPGAAVAIDTMSRDTTRAADSRRTLTVVRRFGWETPENMARTLTAPERRAGGGMLGRVADVAEGPDSAVYVLDSHYHKVVVFNPDGSLRRIILGGEGEGPGEFTRPRGLALSGDGRLFVFDQGAMRVHVFDTMGVYQHAFRLDVPNPHGFAAAGGRLYVGRVFARAGQPAVYVLDEQGQRVDSLVPRSERESELASYGSVGRMGRGADGQLIFAHPTPGIWTPLAPHTGSRRGAELVPDMRTGLVERGPQRGARYTTASSWSATSLQDGTVLILYDETSTNADGELEPRRFSIAVFEAAGHLLDVITLPEGSGGVLASSRLTSSFYGRTEEPYPQVLLYRVVGPAG